MNRPDRKQNHDEGPLLGRLRELEHRWKRVMFARAAGYVLLVTIVVLLLGGALDLTLALSIGQRRLLALACHAGILTFAWGFWLRPYLRPLTPEQIAWLLERAVPSFNEKLISAVELRDAQSANISMALVQHVLADAEIDLGRINPLTAFPLRIRQLILPGTVGLLFIVALCVPSLQLARLVKRVAVPARGDATVGRVELTIVKPTAGDWPEGEPIEFVVRCSDATVRKVEMSFSGHRVRRVLMDYNEADGLFRTVLAQPRGSFDYWAASGKTRSRSHAISVLKRPAIESFELAYQFPDYTELTDVVSKSSSGDLRGYAGTTVDLKIRASMPLVGMALEWNGEMRPVPLDVTGSEGHIRIVMTEPGSYTLHLRAGNNMANLKPLTYAVRLMEDAHPSVTMRTPAADLFVNLSDVLGLEWRAEDDFGVAHQELQTVVNGDARVLPLGPGVDRYQWNVAEFGLVQGDEVEFFLRVYDGRQQQADSIHRKLRVTRGARLKQAGAFVSAAGELAVQLQGLTNRLERVGLAQQKVLRGTDHGTGRDAYDLDHNVTMLAQHREHLEREIDAAERQAVLLVANGFFPRSRQCGDLMQRYLKFNRQFVIRDLLKPRDRQALAALAEMQALTLRMTVALMEKAEQQVPYIEVEEATAVASAYRRSSDPNTQQLRQRLARRAGSIALASDSPLTMHFGADAGKPQGGLRGRYYSGEEQYIQGARQHRLQPHQQRLDHTINLANANAFGAGDPPLAATWSGYVKIATAGQHNFFLNSSGASRLYIDARQVVNNDGDHGRQERHGRIHLEPGIHALHLIYATHKQPPALQLFWQPPGKPRALVPAAVLLAGHADGPLAGLRALEYELGRSANNFGTLDALAREMRGKLKSTQSGIEQLARDLAHAPAAADWEQVAAIAAELLQASAIEAPTTDHPLSVDAARVKDDKRDAAEALLRIAATEDAAGLAEVAEALAGMEQQHELVAVAEKVSEARADVEQVLRAIDTKLASDTQPTAVDADALDSAAERLAMLREMPLAGVALRDVASTRETERQLGEAAANLSRAAVAIQAGRPEEAAAAAKAARLDMRQAEQAIAGAVDKTDPAAELALKKLETFHAVDSEKLQPLIEEMGEAFNAVQNLDAEDRPAIQAASHRMDELAEDVDIMARELEREARRELASEAGDVAEAREKLAVAAALDSARETLLQPAAGKLEESLARKVDEKLSRRKRKKAEAQLQQALEQDLQTAREELAQASDAIAEAHNMLSRAEAADQHELAASETARVEEALAEYAERVLTPELAVALDRLEAVRESRDAVANLSEDVTPLVQRANASQAQALAETVDGIVDQLEKVDGVPALPVDAAPWETAAPASRLPLDALGDKVDVMEEALAHAEGAAERAEEIRADVAAHADKAMALVEAIPQEELQSADRARVAKVEESFDAWSPAVQARELTGLANLPALDSESREEFKAAAAALQKDEARAREAAALEQSAERSADTVARTSAEMQQTVAGSDSSAAEDVVDTLAEISDNTLIGEYEAAQKGLAAFKADLAMFSRGEEFLDDQTTEPLPSDAAAPMVSAPLDEPVSSISQRLQAMVQAAPVLASAADEALPLHARQGLLEAAKAELMRDPEDAGMPEPAGWSPEVWEALAQPLARGDFQTAVELTGSDAATAEAFEKAALVEAFAGDIPLIPEFTAPSTDQPAASIPMQQAAFDAAALAEALHNEPALEHAQSGDYAGAAEALRQQSEAFSEPEHKAWAEKAAAQFDAAAAAQLEALPDALAKAIAATRALDDAPAERGLPAETMAAVQQAADAAAALELALAEDLLELALKDVSDEGKAKFEPLLAEVEKAAAAEQVALARLPEEARDALASVDKLAADSDPVAAMALEEAADLIAAQDYAAAAAQVAVASLAMDERAEDAPAVIDALDALDEAVYGDMSQEAREAVMALNKVAEEIVAAALNEDYSEAAELARAQGEKKAETLFEEAVAAQEEALPVVARDAIAALEKAMPAAGSAERELMEAAVAAARRGDLEMAQAHALAAAAPRLEAAEAAVALEDSDSYRAETIKPLEEALKDAKQNKFGHAANDAARSEAGQAAAELLREAEEQMQAALSEAVEDAYQSDNPQAANALKSAAQQVKANNLTAAKQSAQQAGEAGEETREAIAKAEESGKQAVAELEEALQEAGSSEQAGAAAQQALGEAAAAVEQEEAAAKQSQKLETQAAQALRSAAQAMNSRKLAEAEQLLAQVAEADRAAADAEELPAGSDAEKAQQQREALGEQLQAARDAAAQAAAATQLAAKSAPAEAAEGLKAAVELAQAGNLQAAAQKAQAAGEAGKVAAEALSRAEQARKDVQGAMTAAAASAEAAAREAASAAAEAARQKHALAAAANQAKQGNLAQAAQTARQAAKDSYAALRAADAFQQAEQQVAEAAQSRRDARAQRAAALAEASAAPAILDAVAAPVAEAVSQLEAAESDLAQGKVERETADKIEQASDSLGEAAQSMAQQALGEVMAGIAAMPDSQGEKPASSDAPADPNSDGKAGGAGGGKTDPQEEDAEVPEGSGDLGDAWEGVDSEVGSEDGKRRKMQYDDYYRTANRRYLEAISKKADHDEEE